MLVQLKKAVKKLTGEDRKLHVSWVKKGEGSWLASTLTTGVIKPERSVFSEKIEMLACETNKAGPQPVWEGYQSNNTRGATRTPDGVRTHPQIGDFYTWLVQMWKPETIVEFGTAFGVSGMYFLAGIETNQKGHLLTFDPNDIWRKLAVDCLSRISTRFTSVSGTFEENISKVIAGRTIDIAFIDAIHTSEFVLPQLELVLARCNNKALIILDDISFSDDMRECWDKLAKETRFVSSVALNKRVGILEFIRN